MALNTTTARDTYATLAEADAYFAKRLDTSPWDDAVDATQEKALKQAFLAMERLRYGGQVTRRTWPDETTYGVGDEVYNPATNPNNTDELMPEAESWYYCKLAHTAASDNEPGEGASWSTYWTRMTYKAQWPRDDIATLNWDGYNEDTIPQDVKDAQCEEALELLRKVADAGSSTRLRLQREGVVEFAIGDLRERYGENKQNILYGGQLASREAFNILKPALRQSFTRVAGM